MLALDDPRWGELTHAYGCAADVPGLLQALAASPGPASDWEDEPWYGLWSRLCHQDDIYIASYAAVPHIVGIALATTEPIDFSFLELPAVVEIVRKTKPAPALPADLADAYLHAIAGLPEVVSRHPCGRWDQPMRRAAAAAIAVAAGDIAAAEASLDPDDA